MKKYILVLFLLSSSFSQAIIRATTDRDKATEILSLSKEDRSVLLDQKNEELYQEFKKLAFSDDETMHVRWQSLMAMAQMKKMEAVQDLNIASVSKYWFMRNAAIVAMKNINLLHAERISKNLISDPSLVVRTAAVEALKGQLHIESNRELFWKEIEKKYNFKKGQALWIREIIIKNLSESPLLKEKNRFIQLIKSNDPVAQEPAIVALEKITKKSFGKSTDPISTRHSACLKYLNSSRL